MQQWINHQGTKLYAKTMVLNKVTFTLNTHTITGLLGTNGAGKSTLIKCMLGLNTFDSGTTSTAKNINIGYVPDLIQLPESLTALQLIRHALRIKHSPSSLAETTLKEINLHPRAWNNRIATYSKGMRQRTALAFALAGNPDWLLLDEPMSGLDAMGRKHLLELLQQRHTQGMGIFICSHIVPDLVRLCGRILILSNGHIQEDIDIHQHDMNDVAMIEQKLEYLSHI